MAATLSYQSIRTANQSREADEQRTETRKKNLLILMLQYLTFEGYVESAQSLSRETNIDLNRYEVCDNVDLETVLMEYESFYYIKFARYPKITKKLSQSAAADDRGRGAATKQTNKLKSATPSYQRSATFHSRETNSTSGTTPTLPRLPAPQNKPPTPQNKTRPVSAKRQNSTGGNGSGRREVNGRQQQSSCNGTASTTEAANGLDSLALQGMTVHGAQSSPEVAGDGNKQSVAKQRKAGQIIDFRAMIGNATKLNVEEGANNVDPADRLLKPLGGYVGFNMEWRELAQIISRDIYSENPDVRWDDIIGLDAAKRLVKEAVVYPIRYPELFTGILSPWKGLLLYGPPGTGKTLLAKAVATECKTTFFNISASSIVSKWRGESEKLVRVLFEMARFHAPSTIFLDELESVMSQRGSGGGGEHEGSRRMKTELLVQMDGLAKTDDLVFLLAASNLPWELDHAMLRRLEKRILVDLPTMEARKAMFMHHLPPVVCGGQGYGLQLHADLEYDLLAKKTEGYSGSDIKLVCKEAAMRPVRKIFEILETHSDAEPLHFELDTLTTRDVEIALQHTKPSARNLVGKFVEWQKEYESV